jgi:hypothetical protein
LITCPFFKTFFFPPPCAHTHKNTNAGDGSVLLMPLAAHTDVDVC